MKTEPSQSSQVYRARMIETAQNEFPHKPMTAGEYNFIIYQLGLTQERAGIWLGLSSSTGQRYSSGHATIPGPVSKLLRLMLREGFEPKDVL